MQSKNMVQHPRIIKYIKRGVDLAGNEMSLYRAILRIKPEICKVLVMVDAIPVRESTLIRVG